MIISYNNINLLNLLLLNRHTTVPVVSATATIVSSRFQPATTPSTSNIAEVELNSAHAVSSSSSIVIARCMIIQTVHFPQ